MTSDPFAPLDSAHRPVQRSASPEWAAIFPVPESAPKPPAQHPKRGKPSAVWKYLNADGKLCALVVRFDGRDGEKVVLPLTWQQNAKGREGWRWAAIPNARPLYHVDQLAQRPDLPVLVCEGEKAADAGQVLLSDFIVVTSSGGSKAADKTDWSPLNGRRVLIWPDADEAGDAYAADVARLALEAGADIIAIIEPPDEVERGWDAADALAEGWDQTRAMDLISRAKACTMHAPGSTQRNGFSRNFTNVRRMHGLSRRTSPDSIADDEAEEGARSRKRKRPPQRDQVLSLCEFVELWHDEGFEAWATFKVRDHFENWPIRSREFRRWIAARHYEENGGTLGGQAMEDALRVLDARAVNEGPQHRVFIRSGETPGVIWIDLGDANWRAVKITAVGWEIVSQPECKFRRCQAMLPMPDPEKGAFIEELESFVRVSKQEDMLLIVAWLVTSLRPNGPFPILLVNGEHGSAKSTTSRMLRKLVDPARAPLRSAPKDDQNVAVEAANAWVMAIDNLSSMPNWLSDALCMVATGSGLTTRRLHTDREQEVFDAARPIILNGINDLAERGDLASRGVGVYLPAIPEEERRTEEEIWSEFDEAWPRMMGCLFDGVSRAMQRKSSIRLERLPRMADFARWAEAAGPALGWEPGQFLAAYQQNLKGATESKFENDAVAVVIRDKLFADFPDGFAGTPTALFTAIMLYAPDAREQRRGWPANAAALGKHLRRIAPMLRTAGINFDSAHSGDRMCRLWRSE
ncbi:ATP-binding protein [Roseibium alexandrii]|uniref:ATP-binding protein n=1 Tax=Roseibium alexandrii TaxID=388408 RepID=UPI0037500282